MILDIDHIAISSSDFFNDVEIFSKLDYELEFIENKIKNLIIKKKFMKHFSLNHDLCLLKSKNNINIELLHHEQINEKNGFIDPIFELPKKLHNVKELDLKFQNFDRPNVLKKSINNFIFNKFFINSYNFEDSNLFWSALGFQKINQNQFVFQSIFSLKKYELFLKFTSSKQNYFLDDGGCSCIAFLTNSILNEKKNLEKKYETSKIETLIVNKKEIEIFFVKGPSNELVEIISIK